MLHEGIDRYQKKNEGPILGRASELSFKQLAVEPDVVIISPNDPRAMTQYVRECKELGIRYIYDPSQQIVRLSDDDLRAGIDGSAFESRRLELKGISEPVQVRVLHAA